LAGNNVSEVTYSASSGT